MTYSESVASAEKETFSQRIKKWWHPKNSMQNYLYFSGKVLKINLFIY